MRTVRASEIGVYIYCQRAWWYQLHGYSSENQNEMTGGAELHYRHGRAVIASGCLRALAFMFLLLSLVVFAFYLTSSFL